jgi:O-succinylbenzoate synthase
VSHTVSAKRRAGAVVRERDIVKIDAVEIRHVCMPLVTPWRAAHGTENERDVLVVAVRADGITGYGECGALSAPGYTAEWVGSADEVVRRFLAPAVVGGSASMEALDPVFATVAGHPMAKAALETAVLDAQLRADGITLAAWLGATRDRVPAGVAIGITEPHSALVAAVRELVAAGYVRVKLKIEPGNDVALVAAVRDEFPDVPLQVDANGSYSAHDTDDLAELDAFDLLLIEQPFAADDLLAHAELAARVRTPICLDESITSLASTRVALALHACSVVNIKAARVGGIREARRIHDLCHSRNVPVWCGGMLETGLGRAVNAALAALPGFTLPGDLSASARYYARDLTEPFVLEDGAIRVPTGPGIGVEPLADVLDAATTSVDVITT